MHPVVVIGAGPAGVAAARLLAAWGHRVIVVAKPPAARPALAESIPPSAQKVLATLGLLTAIEDAGLQPWRGNAVWWGDGAPRIETFEEGRSGYQVDRGRFDELLRGTFKTTSVDLHAGTARVACLPAAAGGHGAEADDPVTKVEIETADGLEQVAASFVLDASGRAGVLARHGWRRYRSDIRTIALSGVWTAEAWPVDPAVTMIASYPGGWAWSIAPDARTRHVTVMVDPERSTLERGVGARDVYLSELDKVHALAPALRHATLAAGPWGADATEYDARHYAPPGALLVGDAGATLDPLSSSGVKKALASGWLAAIAVHTAITRPDRVEIALAFFDRREREVVAGARRQAARFAAEAAGSAPPPFWLARAAMDSDHDVFGLSDIDAASLAHDRAVRDAFQDLRARDRVVLRAGPTAVIRPAPLVRGREIVLDDHVFVPDAPAGVRYLRGVDLVELTRLAPGHRDVGLLCEDVGRRQPGAALPDILGALAFLVARGVLEHGAG